jgi:hypothetical protein
VSFFKSGDGRRTPQFIPQGRTRRSRPSPKLRSVTPWISAADIIGFIQSLDFAAVEALITNLKPCAEGFGYA